MPFFVRGKIKRKDGIVVSVDEKFNLRKEAEEFRNFAGRKNVKIIRVVRGKQIPLGRRREARKFSIFGVS